MMKRILTFFILLFAVAGFAQDPSSWKPIGLTMTGSNTYQGITAYYQVGSFNGEDVVFMKLVNDNAYTVTIEWNPGVFNNEHKWVIRDEPSAKRSVTLKANSQLAGDCSGTAPSMVFRLVDFPVEAVNLIRFGVANFKISKN